MGKLIELTEAEIDQHLPKHIERFVQDITQPLDKEKAKTSILRVYQLLKKEDRSVKDNPEIVFCQSPEDCITQALDRYNRLNPTSQLTRDDIRRTSVMFTWRRLWTYAFDMAEELGRTEEVLASLSKEEMKELLEHTEDSRALDFFIPFDDIVYISENPIRYSIEDMRMHDATGQGAEVWPDGTAVYVFKGQRIKEKYGSVPVEQWDPKWIDEETNVDVRRVLLREIGFEKWVKSGGFKTTNTQYLVVHPTLGISSFVDSLDDPIVKKALNTEYYASDDSPLGVATALRKTGKVVKYELLEKQDRDLGRVVYLGMQNPSVQDLHVEPIEPLPWIQTCEDAMSWRQGFNTKPETPINYMFIA